MGLDMNFSYSKTRIPLNKINGVENGWEYFKENTEDVYYFRKFYDLHDFIIGLYKEDDPDGYEKYGDNGTFIELTTEMLEKEKSYKDELFNLRFQLATGQLENTARLKQVRKNIARIKTALREQELNKQSIKEAITNE